MNARIRRCWDVLWRLLCLVGLSAEVLAGHAWWRPIAAVTLLLGIVTTVLDVRDSVNKRQPEAPAGQGPAAECTWPVQPVT
jgi:hypothetical protein